MPESRDLVTVTRNDILTCLGVILSERLKLTLERDSLREDVGLLGQGIGIDSIEMLQIVAAIEEQFSLIVDDHELKTDNFSTIGSLVTFIQGKLAL
jgi:acyl carrier protein